MKENTDYEIIPDMNDDKSWNVRILTGAFTETVIKYGVVKKVNGSLNKKKHIIYNYYLI